MRGVRQHIELFELEASLPEQRLQLTRAYPEWYTSNFPTLNWRSALVCS